MSYLVEVILNFLFIVGSILLFVAPFYLAYRRYHPEMSWGSLRHNAHLEDFLSSTQANWLVFAWAAAEAVVWFIIPEFLLLLVIFLRVKNKATLLRYDILGTALGTIVGLGISLAVRVDVTRIPYITQQMVAQVQAWYHSLGVFGLFFQPFSGIPYKVFVLTAHDGGVHVVGFVFLAIVVRVARYYLFYLLFTGLYPFFHRLISRNYIPIFVLSCLVFSILFLRVYHSFGPRYVVDDQGIQRIGRLFHRVK